jgi:hypothetical protein
MMGIELQDVLALCLVVAAAAVAVWRRATRHRAAGTCAGCASGCGLEPAGSPPERVALDLRSKPSRRHGV